MYRLMKSEKFSRDCLVSSSSTLYRQIEVDRFRHFRAALFACVAASDNTETRYYVLNGSGQEYYDGSWID